MIERQFIAQKTKEFYIRKYVEKTLGNVGISSIRLKKIPLGEKLIIHTSRPSLIVGTKGSNIKALTKALKKEFKLENPQIEIEEVKDVFLDADIVAERIVSSLERFGSSRFKGVGHKMLENVLNAGALGVEIIISGKIPGSRAKNWRFYVGYLKKCGDIAISGVRKAKKSALLKSGIIGIKVSIMPSDLRLPDDVKLLEEPKQIIEEVEVEKKPKKKARRKTRKKSVKKKAEKKVEEKVEKKEKVEEKKVEKEEKKPVEETPKEEETKEEVPPTTSTANEEVKSEKELEEEAVEEKEEEVKEEIKEERKEEKTPKEKEPTEPSPNQPPSEEKKEEPKENEPVKEEKKEDKIEEKTDAQEQSKDEKEEEPEEKEE